MSFARALVYGMVIAMGSYAVYMLLTQEGEAPAMKDGWWGYGSKKPDTDQSIRPFKINVSSDVIADLKTRLARTRLGEDLENTQFQYGVQTTYMKEVLRYWQNVYDWGKHEAKLNTFPQFKTRIEGIEIHFIRVKPVSSSGLKTARPILISHGWPGSVWEFYKLIPRLTDPAKYGGRNEDAFEVICPSIPGYGFSEAPHQQGFDQVDAARVFNKLMRRLGHDKYYVHGGDWGGVISTVMAQAYPEHVAGLHTHFFPTKHLWGLVKHALAGLFPSMFLSHEEQKWWIPLSSTIKLLLMESGYFHKQATKPDTVAVGLTDSPAGLAAHILEIFCVWTNKDYLELPDGGLTIRYTMDELLTNIMIYWVQGNIGSSMRFYKEFIMSADAWAFDSVPVTVPTGLASFPHELFYQPRAFVSGIFKNIVQFSNLPRGGHFAALDEPEILANDMIEFAKKVEELN